MSDNTPLTVVDLIRALQKLPLDTKLVQYSWDMSDGVVIIEDNISWFGLRVKRLEDGSVILFTEYDAEQINDEPLDFSQ